MSPGTQSARYSSVRTPGGKGGSSRFPEFPPPLTAHPLDRRGSRTSREEPCVSCPSGWMHFPGRVPTERTAGTPLAPGAWAARPLPRRRPRWARRRGQEGRGGSE